MTFLRNILRKVRHGVRAPGLHPHQSRRGWLKGLRVPGLHSRLKAQSGSIIILTTFFLGTIGFLSLVGIYTVSRLSSARSYLDGVTRDAAYGGAQLLINAPATASGTGGVVISNDTSHFPSQDATAYGAIQGLVNATTANHSGVSLLGGACGYQVCLNDNTQIYSTYLTTSADQARSGTAPNCPAYYCWEEAGTASEAGRLHYSSGVQVGLTTNVDIWNPTIPFLSSGPIFGSGGGGLP